MQTDYAATGKPPSSGTEQDGYDITRLRRQYTDYLATKRNEIEEQKQSRRYYHGSHWTAAELKILKARNQPPVTYNRVARKVDAVVGLIERLRQDPKAFPRTPLHEQGAEIASATLRYVLDHNEWKGKSPICAHHGAVDGIGGVEYNLVGGESGDPDLEIHIVDPDTFFYDPRSFRDGFSDARYMGVAKWVGIDQCKELVPGKDEEIDALVENGGSDLTSQADREVAWINTHEKKIRLVDHWYIDKGKWRWCMHVGQVELLRGESPFIDERNKSFPKYRMFSGFVDHDGDRYGFIRNLKSAQDEINHRLSKALHMAHSRRLIMKKGAVDDIERTRKEWAKPDGIIEINPQGGDEIKPEDQSRDIAAQFEFQKAAKEEIENFGPNPALVGQGLEDSSGRAIALLQQAGIAELGPYLLAYKSWKGRVYRDIWNIIQRAWTSERWIRVTDDQDVAQFFQLNKLAIGPDGRPTLENAIGQLDMDIIIDEGPDTVNMQADNFSVLQNLGPQFMAQMPEVALELSPIQGSLKKKLLENIKQAKSAPPPPDPKVLAMQAQAQIDVQMQERESQRKQQEMEANIALKKREQDMDFENEQRKMMLGVQADREKAQIKHDSERKGMMLKGVEGAPEEMIAELVQELTGGRLASEGVSQKLDALAEHMAAPAEIVRGPDGRPAGVKKGGRVLSIVRDAAGRVQALA